MFYNECQQSVNRASTILGLASWIIKGLGDDIHPELNLWPPFLVKILATTL